jgi:penicillin amidase
MHEELIAVPGLSGPATITIDRWGIPHIAAANRADLFSAQGFNVARDRLWQIDLWRKRGLGRLAADFGPGYLEQDRASRLFLYRGTMAAEWAAYDGNAEAVCRAFAAGVNAYIDVVSREPDRLPPEFGIAGTKPEKWSAEDVVRIRSHALSRNALSEVLRANVMSRADAETDLLRQNLEPPVIPGPAADIDLAAVPMAVLDLFKLACAAVSFEPQRLAATLEEAPTWCKVTVAGDVERDAQVEGSNNWVVAPARTESGRPILANDPHRTHAIPSLRYLVHLSCPDLDVIGAGEPNSPGVTMGHNGTAAFGLTIFTGPDQEDVYVYETAPDRPDLYRFGDGWEEMHTVEEPVAIRGQQDQTIVLKFTRHGPVVFEDTLNRRAFAIRSVWFEPGSAPYFVGLAAMETCTFESFSGSMARWAVPTVNQVYADAGGDIGWVVAGKVPIRGNWDGLLPVHGDGRFEWGGFMPADQLPRLKNPPAGFLVTANEMNLPREWLGRHGPVGYEWLEASRARRLSERLATDNRHSVAAACALQGDLLSIPALRLCRLLRERRGEASPSSVTMLCAWNCELRADSAAAALFEVWWSRHLRPATIRLLSGGKDVGALIGPGDPATLLRALEAPDDRFGADPDRERDRLLEKSLEVAVRDCEGLMGTDSDFWTWGRLHQAHFIHALSRVNEEQRMPLDVGPFPHGGSSSTPMNSSYLASDFRVTVGASVRLVFDVGDWDRSVCINCPGQSGDPRSRHYGDLAPIWASGDYVPLLYSAEAIRRHSEARLRLIPDADA